MAQIDFLPVATGASANVDSQANFAGSGYQINGFQAGISLSKQLNKVWRQASFITSCIAVFISNQLGGVNVYDDGNVNEFVAQFTAAVAATASTSVTPKLVTVATSPTPVFDCNLGNATTVVFGYNLSSSNTSATIINGKAGQTITFYITSPGGMTFTPPASLPMSPVSGASANNVQQFLCVNTNAYLPLGPMTNH